MRRARRVKRPRGRHGSQRDRSGESSSRRCQFRDAARPSGSARRLEAERRTRRFVVGAPSRASTAASRDRRGPTPAQNHQRHSPFAAEASRHRSPSMLMFSNQKTLWPEDRRGSRTRRRSRGSAQRSGAACGGRAALRRRSVPLPVPRRRAARTSSAVAAPARIHAGPFHNRALGAGGADGISTAGSSFHHNTLAVKRHGHIRPPVGLEAPRSSQIALRHRSDTSARSSDSTRIVLPRALKLGELLRRQCEKASSPTASASSTEDVGIAVRGDREAQAHGHAGGVGLQRRVKEILELGKAHDRVEARRDLAPGEASSRPLILDVLAPGDLRMEPGAQFQQGRQAAADLDGSPVGRTIRARSFGAWTCPSHWARRCRPSPPRRSRKRGQGSPEPQSPATAPPPRPESSADLSVPTLFLRPYRLYSFVTLATRTAVSSPGPPVPPSPRLNSSLLRGRVAQALEDDRPHRERERGRAARAGPLGGGDRAEEEGASWRAAK